MLSGHSSLRLEPWILRPALALARAFDRSRPLPSPERPLRSACIVYNAGLGDGLLVAPMARELKRAFPGVRVSFIGGAAGAAALELCGVADRCVGFPGPTSRFRPSHVRAFGRLLEEERPDVVLLASAPGAAGTAVMARRGTSVVARRGRSQLMHDFWFDFADATVPGGHEDLHAIDSLLDLLRPLGIEPRPSRPTLTPSPRARERARSILAEVDAAPGEFAYILLDGARMIRKDWIPERFGEVARHLHARHGLRCLFEGTARGRALFDGLGLPQDVAGSLHGKLDIETLAAVLEGARICIGIDSGPMHVAQAVGAPTLVLFGGMSETEWGPLPRVAADGDRPLPFRTVRAPGTKWIAWGEPRALARTRAAMEALTVEHVADAADALLAESAALFPRAEAAAAGRFENE